MKLAAFSNFSHMFFPSSFKQEILQKIFEMDLDLCEFMDG